MDYRSNGRSVPKTSLSERPDAVSAPTGPHTSALSTASPSTDSSSDSAPPTAYPPFHHVPPPMMDVDHSTVAEDRSRRATSVLSMDDIEAAQALEGLRTGMSFFPPFALGLSRTSLTVDGIRLRSIAANVADEPPRIQAATRAATVPSHLHPSSHLIRYKRLGVCLCKFQILFPSFQIQRRIPRAQHWLSRRQHGWHRGPEDWRGKWPSVGVTASGILVSPV